MNKMQKQVQEFHEAFGITVGKFIGMRDADMRASLIREEAIETLDAIEAGDMVESLDGLCDLIYVCLGTAVAWGIDLEPFFDEVHASNIAKQGGPMREDGKQLKPEGWKPPRIKELLDERLLAQDALHGVAGRIR